jgi:hypothetical protein
MAKRSIAGLLVVAMMVWAELTLAPMLAMHAGHMRAGHQIAEEISIPHAAHHHGTPMQTPAKHACCPPVHQAAPEGMLELVADISGCHDPHSCCLRQGPQSIPAPARALRELTQRTPAESTLAIAQVNAEKHTTGDDVIASPPHLHIFGMTLRV